jgi:hypothetical protein
MGGHFPGETNRKGPEVQAKSTSNWLVTGLIVFAVATILWLLIPLFALPAAQAQIVLPRSLLSGLSPNYRSDNLIGKFVSLRLTILRELAPGAPGDLEGELLRPVPSATWRDFDGAPPFTATPTTTPTSTQTPTPTATSTPTRIPTRTPTRTPTEEPEEEEPPVTPLPPDVATPEISGGDLDPSPGPIAECSKDIHVIGLKIEDPAPSYGMKSVKLRYRVLGFTVEYVEFDMTPVSEEFKDGGWEGTFNGTAKFVIDIGWDPGDKDFQVELSVRAIDKGNNERVLLYELYTMPKGCAS